MVKTKSRFVVSFTTKIADINESDATPHTLDLSGIVPPGTKAIIIMADRISGTGSLLADPGSFGVIECVIGHAGYKLISVVPITMPYLSYTQSVANDDWDIYLFGYIVESRVR